MTILKTTINCIVWVAILGLMKIFIFDDPNEIYKVMGFIAFIKYMNIFED